MIVETPQGFENSVLERVSDTISLRGGRDIQIEQQVTAQEIDGGAKNRDCIYVFQRSNGQKAFEVPYRALLPQKVDNLLVVGKATAGGAAMRQAHGVLFQAQAGGHGGSDGGKAGHRPAEHQHRGTASCTESGRRADSLS